MFALRTTAIIRQPLQSLKLMANSWRIPNFQLIPPQVVIPIGGYAGKQLHFIGNVGIGISRSRRMLKLQSGNMSSTTPTGKAKTFPLIAGKNVADVRYGHFVPEAEFAYGLKPYDPAPGKTAYHLDEQLPVEANSQLMIFSHRLEHADWPIQSVEFRCTRPKTSLVLAAVTLEQNGGRINPLFYNGKMVRPYPEDTPPAPPSPLEALKDRSREISLDGTWNYRTDPGNEGIRKQFFRSVATMHLPGRPWRCPRSGLCKVSIITAWSGFAAKFRCRHRFPLRWPSFTLAPLPMKRSVWVNGVYVGRHIGPYTSFNIDVTSALHKGAANLVVVRVDCPLDPGYESYKTLVEGNTMDDISMPYGREGSVGGIYRSVILRARGDSGIDDLWASSELSQDLKHADVKVKLNLNSVAPSGKAEIRATLTEPEHAGSAPRNFTATKQVKLDSAQIAVELPLSIDDPLLWYPWEQGTPYLHVLKVEVFRNGELSDTQFIRVGLRQVEFNEQDHYVLVNHHRIFLKGILNDDIHWRSLMDRRGYAQRIKMQKEANINIIRMIAHQSGDDMYDLCDEMGMMIWQEMPLQWEYSRSEPDPSRKFLA